MGSPSRRRGPGRRRRKPNRLRPRKHVTLPEVMLADLSARAAAAAAPKDRCISGQLVRAWQKAAARDYVTGRQIEGDAGVIIGALARLLERWRLPADVEDLQTIRRAAGRLARLGSDLRGGQG